jgi:hypothetical protein
MGVNLETDPIDFFDAGIERQINKILSVFA